MSFILKLFAVFAVLNFGAVFAAEAPADYITSKDLALLRKIHGWQGTLVRNKAKISTEKHDELVKNIAEALKIIGDKLKRIENFPYRGQVADMHYVVANIKKSGNKKYAKKTEIVILAEFHKAQIAAMLKAVKDDAIRKKADDARRRKARRPAPKKRKK